MLYTSKEIPVDFIIFSMIWIPKCDTFVGKLAYHGILLNNQKFGREINKNAFYLNNFCN